MRTLISIIQVRFGELDRRSRSLLSLLTDDQLYQRPREIQLSLTAFSCGEYLLRSAAKVEQTFGGLTTRLWDDPFEWTLPEKLSTTELVSGYLDEVAATTKLGFGFLKTDDDLGRKIPSPDQLRPIVTLLLETVEAASHYQGRAFAIYQVISDDRLPRL